MKVTLTIEDKKDGGLDIKMSHEPGGSKELRAKSDAWQTGMDLLRYLEVLLNIDDVSVKADGKEIYKDGKK